MPARDDRRLKHDKKPPEELLSPERRAEIARENGRKNDGTKQLGISATERAAVRHLRAEEARVAAERLGKTGFRIRKDIDPSVKSAADALGSLALQQMTDAMMGRVSAKKLNGILKSTLAVRAEVCDPLATETRLTGSMTFEQLVAKAAAKQQGK